MTGRIPRGTFVLENEWKEYVAGLRKTLRFINATEILFEKEKIIEVNLNAKKKRKDVQLD